MFKKKDHWLELDTVCNDLIQYRKSWLMVCKVESIDLEMRSDDEKDSIMHVFKQIVLSFNTHVQVIQKKFPLDFSAEIFRLKSNIISAPNERVKSYGKDYVEYLEGVVGGKLDRVNYLIISTGHKCSYEQARPFLDGIKIQIERALMGINMALSEVNGLELRQLFSLPSYIKEGKDYVQYGDKFRRTYIIQDYPRRASPNWLRPLLSFPRELEISQHFHPYPKDRIIDMLELAIAKFESTLQMQEGQGLRASSEITSKKNDAEKLLERLAGGEDSIVEVGFYVTISAESLEKLDAISYEIENTMRQLELKFRRNVKDSKNALISSLPLCRDMFIVENYTFDTKSLATLLPFVSQDYTKGGIVYGVNDELSELISFDIFDLNNPNKIILGVPGSGKSLLSKLLVGRHTVNGAQSIIIDHNSEYAGLCDHLGGQYVNDGIEPDWNQHLIVFGGDKVKSLLKIWEHIRTSPLRERTLTIEEFHNILQQDKDLILKVIREIRKLFTATTLITQNVKEFLRHSEGQMIMDCCAIKIFMKQGENDMEEIERLFDFNKRERMYLKTCRQGHGYIVTDLFKTKFRADYSPNEHHIVTTNPRERIDLNVGNRIV